MLYPDFNELIAFKDRKSKLKHPSYGQVKTTVLGNHHSPFRGQGLEFDSVREYVPGDDIRSIDWRVTARTGFPHVKLFREDRERHIAICVDMNADMRFGTKKTFKSIQAARVASLLGWQGIASQDRVSACLFGDVSGGIQFFEPTRTRKSFSAMLKMLAEPPTEQHCISLEKAAQHLIQTVQKGTLVYLISDFMSVDKNYQYEGNLSRLRKMCDIVFIAINDQADKLICPVGTIGFHGNEKNKIYVDTESASGRKAYAMQWDENRQRLNEIAFKLKIPTIELTTESDVHRDLILGLKSIAKRKK